jgi:putative exosortase-associated protein (TIGR04073 family)
MIRLKFIPALLMALAVLFFTAAPSMQSMAPAQTASDEDVYRENTDIDKIFTKLGRGVVNVLTGWVEIPRNIAKEWRRTDPFTGTVIGLFRGLGWAVARTFAGFYEIISFPFPVPRNYEPIMQPEYILPTVWGERLPLYRDEFVGTGQSINSAVDYGTSSQQRVGGRSY